MELNPEARYSESNDLRFDFGVVAADFFNPFSACKWGTGKGAFSCTLLPDFFCEVIYAVMSVTPWKRLSESVLADSIIAFYIETKMIPPGMPVGSLQGWSSRMAYGTRKIVQRFRKIFAASPSLAKSATVTALKRRLLADGIQATTGTVHRQLSQSDLEELHVPAFDWEALTQKIMEAKLAKKKPTEAVEQKDCRPVASAARSHRLPPLVLAALGQQPSSLPKPVAMTGGQEDEAGTAAESTVKTGSPKKSKSAKKKKGGGKKKRKGALWLALRKKKICSWWRLKSLQRFLKHHRPYKLLKGAPIPAKRLMKLASSMRCARATLPRNAWKV